MIPPAGGTNAIHGLQNVQCLSDGQCPTSFPAPCAMAAAFNTSLTHGMGAVLGRELRAYYNAQVHDSLDTWSPTLNVNRDPRWGRNVECDLTRNLLIHAPGFCPACGSQEIDASHLLAGRRVKIRSSPAASARPTPRACRRASTRRCGRRPSR